MVSGAAWSCKKVAVWCILRAARRGPDGPVVYHGKYGRGLRLQGQECHGGVGGGKGSCPQAAGAEAVALSGALFGGRQAGALQQPRRAQHKALFDGPEELALFQYPCRCSVQRCDLQPDLKPQRRMAWTPTATWFGS